MGELQKRPRTELQPPRLFLPHGLAPTLELELGPHLHAHIHMGSLIFQTERLRPRERKCTANKQQNPMSSRSDFVFSTQGCVPGEEHSLPMGFMVTEAQLRVGGLMGGGFPGKPSVHRFSQPRGGTRPTLQAWRQKAEAPLSIFCLHSKRLPVGNFTDSKE